MWIYEVYAVSDNKLKENLGVSFIVQFSGLSSSLIERVKGDLLDSTIDVKIKNINDKINNIKICITIYSLQKYINSKTRTVMQKKYKLCIK